MGQQLFFKTYIRDRNFLTETENCLEGSWWLYLSGKNDISWIILLKPIFYPSVIVSRY